MSSPERSVDHEGCRVVYDSYGLGDHALIFLHGWCCNSTHWDAQQPLFETYRSLNVDLPGHGRSDAPDMDYGPENCAEAVVAILQAEKISKVVVIGHCWGGCIGTMMLRLHPDVVAGIIDVDSFMYPPVATISLAERKAHPLYSGDDTIFRETASNLCGPKLDTKLREKVTSDIIGSPKHVRIAAAVSGTMFHPFRDDEKYDVPAVRHQGPVLPPADPRWTQHLPQLQVEEWDEYGHFLMLEDPQRLNGRIEEFLDQHRLLSKLN